MPYPANATFVDNFDPSIRYDLIDHAREDAQLSTRARLLVQAVRDPYNGTLSVTTDPDMNFEFIFYGQILQMYGASFTWLPGRKPLVEYTIDDDPEVQFVLSTPAPTSNVLLYVSTLLPIGFHTLTVSVKNATADGPFLFDYIVFGIEGDGSPEDPSSSETVPPPISSQSSTSASPSAPSTSSLVETSAPAAGSSPTETALPPAVTPFHPPVFPAGPVVGAVVGGVVVLFVIILIWKCFFKRKEADRASIEPAIEAPQPESRTTGGFGEKGSASSPPPWSAESSISALKRPIQYSSWVSRDSEERWPYTARSLSTHQSGSTGYPKEKTGMSVVNSEPRTVDIWIAGSEPSVDADAVPDAPRGAATPSHAVLLDESGPETNHRPLPVQRSESPGVAVDAEVADSPISEVPAAGLASMAQVVPVGVPPPYLP